MVHGGGLPTEPAGAAREPGLRDLRVLQEAVHRLLPQPGLTEEV